MFPPCQRISILILCVPVAEVKARGVDDRCSNYYGWTDEMWEEVSMYHKRFAVQLEKEKNAKSSFSFSAFSTSVIPIPVSVLSASFGNAITATIATSSVCTTMYETSSPIV